MAGGGGGGSGLTVGLDELLWRFIDDVQYQPNSSGTKEIQQAAFVGEISMVRVSLGVTEALVDSVKGGQFAKHGIAVLKASEIRAATNGDLRVTPDPDWPPNAHVIFVRSSGGKHVKAQHSEATDLTDLANQRPLHRLPIP